MNELTSDCCLHNIFILLCGYVVFRLKQAQRRVEKLIEENAQLQTEKAVAQTQVKHHQVRQKMKKALVALIVSGLLTACTTKTISVINPSCSGFKVIKASRQDTTETLRQILVHNQTYRQICSKQGELK